MTPLYPTTIQYKVIGEGEDGTATTVVNEPGTHKDAELLGSGEFTFDLCESEKIIELKVYDDDYIEGNETVTIELTADEYQDPNYPSKKTNTFGTSELVFTIIDDDYPVLSFDTPKTVVEEGEAQVKEIQIPVSLDNAPVSDVMVPFSIVHKSLSLEDSNLKL